MVQSHKQLHLFSMKLTLNPTKSAGNEIIVQMFNFRMTMCFALNIRFNMTVQLGKYCEIQTLFLIIFKPLYIKQLIWKCIFLIMVGTNSLQFIIITES